MISAPALLNSLSVYFLPYPLHSEKKQKFYLQPFSTNELFRTRHKELVLRQSSRMNRRRTTNSIRFFRHFAKKVYQTAKSKHRRQLKFAFGQNYFRPWIEMTQRFELRNGKQNEDKSLLSLFLSSARETAR